MCWNHPSLQAHLVLDKTEQAKSAKLTSSGYPKLANTLHELERLLTKKSGGLRSFRAAILDYLFQYKWSVSYPNRFSPYNLERSAGRLNAVFSPIIQAFNTDVQIFVEGMQQHPAWPTAPDAEGAGAVLRKMFFNKEPTLEGMVTSGRVRIVSLSGSAAGVSGKTVSFFDMTPPPTFVVPATPPAGNTSGSSGSNAGGSSSGGATEIGSVASQLGLGVLSPLTAGTLTTALRALQQPQPITVEVAKGLTLYVTPHSLAAASEAELNLNLVVGEESAPKVAEGAGNEHLLDRISEARLQTTVRVPGVRLFEVSNFALDVQVPRPDGIFPIVGHAWNSVFGQVPVVRGFFKWKREPATVYHRNLVVVNAIIAPTAADLALGLRFHKDLLPKSVTDDSEKANECFIAMERAHQLKLHAVLGLPIPDFSKPLKPPEQACK